MTPELEKRLAESLTAESTGIIPYLPYLLQDFWGLSSDPDEMAELLTCHTDFNSGWRILDLACGKGMASVCLVRDFGCSAKGVDLIEAFIDEAREKAAEHGVSDKCVFIAGDVNEAVAAERGYDLAIWGGAGDLMGSYAKTISGIARTVKPGGYILFDDAYLPEEGKNLRFHHNYLTKSQWLELFKAERLTVIACNDTAPEYDPKEYEEDLGNIKKRAEELALEHPDKREMFEGYVKNQQSEYEDLQDGLIPSVWLLKKPSASEE